MVYSSYDVQGNMAKRYDSYLNLFTYAVIAMPKPPPDNKIPGYPIYYVVVTLIISITALVILGHYKKYFKKGS